MCHSFLDYPTYQRLQQPKALWRCGVCGRQSAAPMDCCSRPDFALQRQPGAVHLAGRQLVEVGSLVITHLRTWWHRRQRPATGQVTAPVYEMPTPEAAATARVEADASAELVGAGRD